MRRALIPAFLLLLGSAVLGATVLREPIAHAAAPITSVFVTNDALHPVPVHEQGTAAVADVNSPAHTPVTVSALAVASPDNNCHGSDDFYTVPTGKTLVVEFVSAVTVVGEGQSPLLSLETGSRQYRLPVVAGATGNSVSSFRWLEPVTIYAAAGTQLTLSYFSSEFGGDCSASSSADLTINGYLINA